MKERIRFPILCHEKAPIFSEESNPGLVLEQLLGEVRSGRLQTSDEIRELIRQAGFVNLWFYLKVIAGYSGPYNELNDGLHLDMCNFRQGEHCMRPGAHAACFAPRGHYKSTVLTHGPDGWECLRNPDIRIALVSNIADKAEQFTNIIKATFRDNEFFKWLYPEYVLPPHQAKFVLPNRTRKFSEPNIKPFGAGAASEGDHFNLFDLDDPIGLNDLNAERKANAEMQKKANWAKTSERALLTNLKKDRVLVKGTRYAVDDMYQDIIDDAYVFQGFKHEKYIPKDNGTWAVYYRKAVEEDKVIFPENFTVEAYNKMKKDPKTFWTYQTQYLNDPYESGIAEFYKLEPRRSKLVFSGDPYVTFRDEDGYERKVFLSEMNIVLSSDFAFSKKGNFARLCRTALVVWAMDSEYRRFLLDEKVGFFSSPETFEFIFKMYKKYNGFIQFVIVETNAQQKGIVQLLEQERWERREYLPLRKINATSDKTAKIRLNVGGPLQDGMVFLCDHTGSAFEEERQIFPQSDYRKDTLDATEKAFTTLRRPYSEEEYEESESFVEEKYAQVSELTGY